MNLDKIPDQTEKKSGQKLFPTKNYGLYSIGICPKGCAPEKGEKLRQITQKLLAPRINYTLKAL